MGGLYSWKLESAKAHFWLHVDTVFIIAFSVISVRIVFLLLKWLKATWMHVLNLATGGLTFIGAYVLIFAKPASWIWQGRTWWNQKIDSKADTRRITEWTLAKSIETREKGAAFKRRNGARLVAPDEAAAR